MRLMIITQAVLLLTLKTQQKGSELLKTFSGPEPYYYITCFYGITEQMSLYTGKRADK